MSIMQQYELVIGPFEAENKAKAQETL